VICPGEKYKDFFRNDLIVMGDLPKKKKNKDFSSGLILMSGLPMSKNFQKHFQFLAISRWPSFFTDPIEDFSYEFSKHIVQYVEIR
jgi:hypothetical protein